MLIAEGTGEGIARAAAAKIVLSHKPYFIHSGGGTTDGPYMIKSRDPQEEKENPTDLERRYCGYIKREWYAARPSNANRKKKAKRKQAQASRRKNRR